MRCGLSRRYARRLPPRLLRHHQPVRVAEVIKPENTGAARNAHLD
jgi:hypothetical protein